MTAGALCFIMPRGCASGKKYGTFVKIVRKLGSKVNMCCISIIIHAAHHWPYESLMISVYSGHNYRTKDAALACTGAIKIEVRQAGSVVVSSSWRCQRSPRDSVSAAAAAGTYRCISNVSTI